MFYSDPPTIAADAILVELGVHQLASWIPFEGVAQHNTVRTLQHCCKFAAAKLRICANQVNRFYIESCLFLKIMTIRGLILKILKMLAYLSLHLIYPLKE
jgi:hypothetical protein